MEWHHPSIWLLSLFVLLPLLAWHLFGRRRRAALRFSSTDEVRQLPRTWRTRLRWLPNALRLLAIALLIVGLSRPREGRVQSITDTEGIAIQLLVDRSGSMRAMDFEVEGQPVDRLTAVKKVAGEFITGNDELTGRDGDLIGLITFARYADSDSPLTLDHDYLTGKLYESTIATRQSEDGTAIGDAIGLGVERLRGLEESREKDEPLQGKVMILLTDGENNAGSLDPLQAAALAETLGVRVYTIGVGTQGFAPVPVTDPFSGRQILRSMRVNIDEQTLEAVAEATGGKYFRATDTDSLEAIYAEIDRIEKTRIEQQHFTEYRELAIQPVRASVPVLGVVTIPPILLVAFALVAVELILSNTVLRKAP